MAVIGTPSGAGIDGETIMTLEFVADVARHGEAHLVLEVEMTLSISASYIIIETKAHQVLRHLWVPK